MATKHPQKSLATLKTGDKFSVVSFTGMNLGQFTVKSASKTQIKAIQGNGNEMIFDRKDGIQTNANNPLYANKAVDLMDPPAPRAAKPKKKAEPKKAAKAKPAPEPEDDEDMEDDDEDDAPPPPKKAKGNPVKKVAPVEEIDENDEDEEWEDDDEDDE